MLEYWSFPLDVNWNFSLSSNQEHFVQKTKTQTNPNQSQVFQNNQFLLEENIWEWLINTTQTFDHIE